MDFLLAGGQYFNGKQLFHADILVKDGKIAEIGPGLFGHSLAKDALLINALGCVCAPGFTDLHVHLRQPGFEEKETIETGCAAAAAGGFTTVCAMPNLAPVPHNLQNLDIQLKIIEKTSTIRVLPYGAISAGQNGTCLADIGVLSSFVCGFTDDGKGVQSAALMRRAMAEVAQCGSFVAAHCEDENLIAKGSVCVQKNSMFAKKHGYVGYCAQSEWQEVERDIALAQETGCRLHICHASAAKTFALVQSAKSRGLPVTCEVSPHNLLLSCNDIVEDNGRFKMNPPLREEKDRQAAIKALQDGTVDAIATDHAPHTEKEKAASFAHSLNGVVGLETAFAACYTGLVKKGVISLEKLLYLLTEGPRKVLLEKQEPLQKGTVANLVLLNLNCSKTVQPKTFKSKGRFSPFQGQSLTGWPILTFCQGRLVHRQV